MQITYIVHASTHAYIHTYIHEYVHTREVITVWLRDKVRDEVT